MAAYACAFDTVWVEETLDNGRRPAPEGDNDPERLFADYQDRLDKQWSMHERTVLAYHLLRGSQRLLRRISLPRGQKTMIDVIACNDLHVPNTVYYHHHLTDR